MANSECRRLSGERTTRRGRRHHIDIDDRTAAEFTCHNDHNSPDIEHIEHRPFRHDDSDSGEWRNR